MKKSLIVLGSLMVVLVFMFQGFSAESKKRKISQASERKTFITPEHCQLLRSGDSSEWTPLDNVDFYITDGSFWFNECSEKIVRHEKRGRLEVYHLNHLGPETKKCTYLPISVPSDVSGSAWITKIRCDVFSE